MVDGLHYDEERRGSIMWCAELESEELLRMEQERIMAEIFSSSTR